MQLTICVHVWNVKSRIVRWNAKRMHVIMVHHRPKKATGKSAESADMHLALLKLVKKK